MEMMRVLVVDDDPVSRTKMQKIMNSFGSCQSVDGGEPALAAFKAARAEAEVFDLISLDINMPDMSGIDVLSEIREIEKQAGVPRKERVRIMMVTSYSDQDTVTACIKAGCSNYIVKPFDRARVSNKLRGLGFNI